MRLAGLETAGPGLGKSESKKIKSLIIKHIRRFQNIKVENLLKLFEIFCHKLDTNLLIAYQLFHPFLGILNQVLKLRVAILPEGYKSVEELDGFLIPSFLLIQLILGKSG